MDIKALGKIRHNGKDYIPGQIVPGLTQEEYDRLIQLKAGEEVEQSSSSESQEYNDFTGFQLNGAVVLSVEDFANLKADDQKAHLKALEIEPAGKEEDRIAQYEEWYAEQVTAGGND
ncbi:hypothetical protein [Paenibacillus glucanolyticus]|uniref:hypothetical protein n=1 Tax=Paenibacillus glucanolyticus TaxID=59843 RepID=UPI0030CC3B0A